LQTVAARHHKARTFRHDSNRGQSAAVRTGVKLATAELIAVIDGAGQNDPADIPLPVRALQDTENVRTVIGERVRRQDNWLKLFSSRVANRVILLPKELLEPCLSPDQAVFVGQAHRRAW